MIVDSVQGNSYQFAQATGMLARQNQQFQQSNHELCELGDSLYDVIVKDRKSVEDIVKDYMKLDPTGKKVVDLYERATKYLSHYPNSKAMKESSAKISKIFLKSTVVKEGENIKQEQTKQEQAKEEETTIVPEEMDRMKKLNEEYELSKGAPSPHCIPTESKDEFFARFRMKLKDLPKLNFYNISNEINEKVISILKEEPAQELATDEMPKKGAKCQHTFASNRTGRDLPPISLDASDVKTSMQNYICSAVVTNPEFSQDYFTAAIAQNVSIFVSTHEIGDDTTGNSKFWSNEVLKQFPDANGWQIENTGEIEIARSETIPDVRIIESKLVATRGDETRELVHLHYLGWKDNWPAPDEKLLQFLIQRMKEINPDNNTIAINCKGGIGRTGITAACHNMQLEIDQQLKKGVVPDDVEINVPELAYTFRKQRRNLFFAETRIAQLLSITTEYYNKLQSQVSV